MPQVISINLKKYLLTAGIFLAFIVFGWPSIALAEDSTTANADSTSDQTAASGNAATNPEALAEPAPAPEVTQEAPAVAETTVAEPQTATETTPTPPEPVPVLTCTAEPTAEESQPAVEASAEPASGGSSGQTDTNNSTINNDLCSSANSGDAAVTDNTGGGDATSGDAEAIATILNIINSVTGLSGSDLVAFIQNVYGDQFGDLLIDPSLLGNLPAEGCDNLCLAKIILNSSTNSEINNDITMSSNSGNADVSYNGLGGNATTGDATTILNLVNIINSIISTGQSFIGIINIYGNLDGDILLPPELMEALLNPDATGSNSSPPSVWLDVNNTQAIHNNLNLSATSGNATVSDNYGAGNATTGDASTSLKVFNLTGSQIIGSNALLVFINVLGEWVGLILNAPDGATSAMLGGGLSDCTSLCGGKIRGDISTVGQINNNINLSAISGNASVSNNWNGGNATSGNATTSLNLVNIINSYISLADWFGIIFINVFGTWNGSFGIDTAAGELPVSPSSGSGLGGPSVGSALSSNTKKIKKVYSGGQNESQSEDQNVALAGYSGPGNPITESLAADNSMAWLAAIASLCGFMGLAGVDRARKGRKAGLIQQLGEPQIIRPSSLQDLSI